MKEKGKYILSVLVAAVLLILGISASDLDILSGSTTQNQPTTAVSVQLPGQATVVVPNADAPATVSDLVSVVRIVDGDTIIVSINGKDERVRLIGVDTPESVHPDAERNIEYGKIASDYSKKRLEGKSVGLEFDVQERDKYGRLLAYVYLDGKMFNRELLEKGHAKIMTYPPNVRYANEFTALQAAARKKKVGVWAYEDTAGESAEIVSRKDAKFIGNVDTLKFHLPTCRYAVDLQDYKAAFFSKRTDAVDAGYEACGVCKP